MLTHNGIVLDVFQEEPIRNEVCTPSEIGQWSLKKPTLEGGLLRTV